MTNKLMLLVLTGLILLPLITPVQSFGFYENLTLESEDNIINGKFSAEFYTPDAFPFYVELDVVKTLDKNIDLGVDFNYNLTVVIPGLGDILAFTDSKFSYNFTEWNYRNDTVMYVWKFDLVANTSSGITVEYYKYFEMGTSITAASLSDGAETNPENQRKNYFIIGGIGLFILLSANLIKILKIRTYEKT